MDSDDEDVSENDILDWYRSEVADIWDTATDSAFADLSSNFSDMFRQVMNDVKLRSQPVQTPNGYAVEVNGHSSTVNGVHEPPTADEPATNTVSVSSDQLMAMLQDDEDWLEESNTSQDEEMVLSVQLTDTPNQTEEDQKNVKGVSRETSHLLADSILMLFRTAIKISLSPMEFMLYFIITLFVLSASISLIFNTLQDWFLRFMQGYIYPCMTLLQLANLPLFQYFLSINVYMYFLSVFHEESYLISNSWDAENSDDCRSFSQVLSMEKKNISSIHDFINSFFHSDTPILIKKIGVRNTLKKYRKVNANINQLLQNNDSFSSKHFSNLNYFLEHPEQDTRTYWKINLSGRRFHRLFIQPRFVLFDTAVALH